MSERRAAWLQLWLAALGCVLGLVAVFSLLALAGFTGTLWKIGDAVLGVLVRITG